MEIKPMEAGTPPLLVSRAALSKITSISPRHLANLSRVGILPSIKLGHRCVRYSPTDCIAALKARFEAKAQA